MIGSVAMPAKNAAEALVCLAGSVQAFVNLLFIGFFGCVFISETATDLFIRITCVVQLLRPCKLFRALSTSAGRALHLHCLSAAVFRYVCRQPYNDIIWMANI